MDSNKQSSKTNPSKETIRRICTLFNCQHCWLLDDGNKPIPILVDVDSKEIDTFQQDLQTWTGYEFAIYLVNQKPNALEKFKRYGEQLLPLDSKVPIQNIKMRAKKNLAK